MRQCGLRLLWTLCALLLSSRAVLAHELMYVSNFSDWIELAGKAKDRPFDVDVVLTGDINHLTQGESLKPLGTTGEGCVPYSGTFDGRGFKIMHAIGAVVFCALENATVMNVVIDSTCNFLEMFLRH